ncbi:MAG: ribosomal protein S18-alanine N-acetyltransferase [Pseudomonadota bacterium]
MNAVVDLTQPEFRVLSESDVPRICEIERASYQFPWSATVFSDCLTVGYFCWGCFSDDFLLGYGIMSVAANEAHILNICMAPEVRRQGFARDMMRHLAEIAVDNEARIMFLEVRPSNQGAINLYQTLGFSQVGRRKDYYPARGGREDALVLSRNFDTN